MPIRKFREDPRKPLEVHVPLQTGNIFEDGGNPPKIILDFIYEVTIDMACCPHATDRKVSRRNGYTLYSYRVPRVLVAFNEGGYASTHVCLDCVLEKLEEEECPNPPIGK